MNSHISDGKVKRASGKRNKKRKFTGNMYTRKTSASQSTVLNESASERKIGSMQDLESDSFEGYRMIDINLLFTYLENYVSCKSCGGDISLKEHMLCGLSSKISLICKYCNEVCSFRNSAMIGNKVAEINRRFMYAMRTMGKRHAAMSQFCGVMDLSQPPSKKSYNATVKKLVDCTSIVAKKSIKQAAKEECHLEGSSNINVSGDGTWKTRGYSSRVGVCSVIGDQSGKVLDTEVLSSFCKACDSWKSRKGTPAYESWKSQHDNDCLINHTGSSGKMEVVGMVRIFERSEKLNDAKYIGYIGDGDTKTFIAITENNPYDVPVSKIECVGHVQKRMGTRLRKLKSNHVKCSDGKSVGGKGRLTDKLIDKLSIYYGNAIRQHKHSLSDMRKAVWAIYFHTRSDDSEPLHTFCPSGSESWCKYQAAKANGSENAFSHKTIVPRCVMDAVKPIFNDLSHPNLLQRCLGGKTQNNNESLNSLIWKFCPKTQGTGKRIVEIATNEAVIAFNEGGKQRIEIMKEFGLIVGFHASQYFKNSDQQRIQTSNKRMLQSTKDARKSKKMKLKSAAENYLLSEGDMYAAGAF